MSQTIEKNFIAGKWELAIGNVLIPADLLGDISVKYTEKSLEWDTQAGISKMPSGIPETAEMTFNLFVPNIDYLKHIWPDYYESSTAGGGAINFGKGMPARTPKPVNIHQSGAKTDESDFHIYAGLANVDVNAELSTSDVFAIEVTINAQPTENGYIRIGSGSKTGKSIYDVATQTTKPVSG